MLGGWRNLQIKSHLKPVIILFVSVIAVSIYHTVDVAMLGFLKGNADVGYYNVSLKIKSIVWSVASALVAVAVPQMASFYQNKDSKKWNNLLKNISSLCFVCVVPIALFIGLNAQSGIMIIAGREFFPATTSLSIFMFAMPVFVFNCIFANMLLIPSGKEKIYTQSIIVAMVINVVLNCFFIPLYGATGAAVATVVAEVLNLFWMAKSVREECGWSVVFETVS